MGTGLPFQRAGAPRRRGQASRARIREGQVSRDILVGTSAQEWFREAITDVLAQRRLKIQEATEFYLVDLPHPLPRAGAALRRRGGRDRRGRAARARPAEGAPRGRPARPGPRASGGSATRRSSSRASSATRSPARRGRRLLHRDGRAGLRDARRRRARRGGRRDLYGELAERFGDFVDLFAEIAERSSLGTNRGLLRLYERFLLTRSERVAERLRARGVALFSGPAAPPRGTIQ